MRRTVLVPTMAAAALRARRMLGAMSLAALLVLALTPAAPAAAQEETTSGAQAVTKNKVASGKQEQLVQGSGQEAEASSCATDADEVDTFTAKDTSFGPFRITSESFDVLYEARAEKENGSFKVAVVEDRET